MKEYAQEYWAEVEIDKVVDGYYNIKEDDKLKIGVTSDNS